MSGPHAIFQRSLAEMLRFDLETLIFDGNLAEKLRF